MRASRLAVPERDAPYRDPRRPAAERAADLVRRMTVDEKIGQLMTSAPEIPRLGVPAYDWWSEALHGVARAGRATVFPQAIALAATFDAPLVERVATAISDEARAKFNLAEARGERGRYQGLTFFSPNINIFRDPRWGRGQETYGEDPLLTARMGVAFIEGMQGVDPRWFKTVATAKHFAVHSGPEADRHSFDARPSAHDLADTYLPQFEAAVREAHVGSVMAAYNRVDGAPAAASARLLDETLRKAWGFGGYVVGDCGAVDDIFAAHHAAPSPEAAAAMALRAGTDLDCGRAYAALGPGAGAGPGDRGGARSGAGAALHRALPAGAVRPGDRDPLVGARRGGHRLACPPAAGARRRRPGRWSCWRIATARCRSDAPAKRIAGGRTDGRRQGRVARQLSRDAVARGHAAGRDSRGRAGPGRERPLRARGDAGRVRAARAPSSARRSPPRAGATSWSPSWGSIRGSKGKRTTARSTPPAIAARSTCRGRRRSCSRRWWPPASR